MARPATAPKYEGEPCKICGTTLRYTANNSCVECTRVRNAANHPPRTPSPLRTKQYQMSLRLSHYKAKGETVPELSTTNDRILSALSRDAHAAVIRQSKMYLGIPKHMQQPEAAPMTGGDVWRSMLTVGKPGRISVPNEYKKKQPVRAGQYSDLVKAVADLLPTLPDVVIPSDVIARLPAAMVETFGSRLSLNLARALHAAGAVRRHTSTNAHNKAAYFVRFAEIYNALSVRSIVLHRDARTRTRPGGPMPTGEPRGQGRRKHGAVKMSPEERNTRRRAQYHARNAAKAAARAAAKAAGFPWQMRDSAAAKEAVARAQRADMAESAESSPTGTAGPLTSH